jgi:hypothetical protein
LGFPCDVDLEQGGPGHNVIVGDGDTGGVNDEARAAPGGIADLTDLRIDEGPLGFDLDRRRLDVFEV